MDVEEAPCALLSKTLQNDKPPLRGWMCVPRNGHICAFEPMGFHVIPDNSKRVGVRADGTRVYPVAGQKSAAKKLARFLEQELHRKSRDFTLSQHSMMIAVYKFRETKRPMMKRKGVRASRDGKAPAIKKTSLQKKAGEADDDGEDDGEDVEEEGEQANAKGEDGKDDAKDEGGDVNPPTRESGTVSLYKVYARHLTPHARRTRASRIIDIERLIQLNGITFEEAYAIKWPTNFGLLPMDSRQRVCSYEKFERFRLSLQPIPKELFPGLP